MSSMAVFFIVGAAGAAASAQTPARTPLLLDVNRWQGGSGARPVAMHDGRLISAAYGAVYVPNNSAFNGLLALNVPADGGAAWGDFQVLFRSASDGSASLGPTYRLAAGVVSVVSNSNDPLTAWRLQEAPNAPRIPLLFSADALEPYLHWPCNGGVAMLTVDSPWTRNQARLFWTDGTGAAEQAAPIADLSDIPPTDTALYQISALDDGRSVVVIGRQTFGEPPPPATCDVFITDGTAAGTHRLGGRTLTRRFAKDGSFVSLNGAIYSIDGPVGDRTAAPDPVAHIERWEHPYQVSTPIATQQPLTRAKFLTSLDGRLLLHAATDGGSQASLRSLDPATGEMMTLGDSRASVFKLRTGDGVAFIEGTPAAAPFTDGRLWFTDGTAAGTRALDELAGSASRVNAVAQLGDALVVAACTSPDTVQVRRISADLSTFTVLASERSLNLSQFADGFVPSDDGRLAFCLSCDRYGEEPWVTDGTPAGTRVVRDFSVGTAPGKPAVLGAFQGKMILSAEMGYPGRLLLLSDGTYDGTRCVSSGYEVQLPFTSALDRPYRVAAVGDRFIYFLGGVLPYLDVIRYDDQTGACEVMPKPFNGQLGTVWNTPGGVVVGMLDANNIARAFVYPAADQAPSVPATLLGNFGGAACRLGNEVYFGNPRLTATDGTAAGTRVVDANVVATQIITLGDKLIYRSAGMVYAGDGHTSTQLVPTPPAGVGVQTGEIVAGSTSAYFLHNISGQVRLWRTDGTPAGTRIVYSTPSSTEDVKVAAVEGDTALFSVTKTIQGVTRRRPWVSRGTAATTAQLADITLEWDTSPNSSPGTAQAIGAGGRIYFAANDGVHGRELWSTNGRPGSARLESDLIPGSTGSFPQNFALLDGRLYFAAAHPQIGMELTTLTIGCNGADLGSSGGVFASDRRLDNNDFIVFINLFFAQDPEADMGVAGGHPGSDGRFDNNDFIAFISKFFEGC